MVSGAAVTPGRFGQVEAQGWDAMNASAPGAGDPVAGPLTPSGHHVHCFDPLGEYGGIKPAALDQRGRKPALRVIAEGLVKRRELTCGTIDLVGLAVIRIVEEGDVDLERGGGGGRESVLGSRPKHGLTSDDEHLGIISDLGR